MPASYRAANSTIVRPKSVANAMSRGSEGEPPAFCAITAQSGLGPVRTSINVMAADSRNAGASLSLRTLVRANPSYPAANASSSCGNGRIEKKGGSRDAKIFGVGRFENQQAARRETPMGLCYQCAQDSKGQVLSDMKARYQGKRVCRRLLQVVDRVAFVNDQPDGSTLCKHPAIGIDPNALKVLFLQNLQPFATTASKVNGTIRIANSV